MTVQTVQAEEVRSFYAAPELAHVGPQRAEEILEEVAATGTYTQTLEELSIGASIAWRNHARCSGRLYWRSLKVVDMRHLTDVEDIAEACWEHLRFSTNGGALRTVMTVFAPALPNGWQIRIWNPQLVRYAGYRQADGSVVGDPLHIPLTEVAMRLGWRGAGTAFDILPVIIQVGDDAPRWFQPPADAVLEVPISHPEFPWFADLGLKWHANPAVTNLSMEVGGLTYTAIPFSGWYVSCEIGARNLSDVDRYNLLPVVAERMGLDTSSTASMWQDKALIELTQAVLHSYQEAGVKIIDHHTNANQFMAHVKREVAEGREVPVDWSWINPPLSASTTPTFHRYFDPPAFDVRPNFIGHTEVEALAEILPMAPEPASCPVHIDGAPR